MPSPFFVPGVPRPQGSKDHIGGGRMVESSKGLHEWRWRVGLAANQVRGHSKLYSGAVRVTCEFIMPRPKGMKPETIAPPHTHPPDLDKLVRGVLDALKGTLLVDDALVTSLGDTCKRTAAAAEPPGVHITITSLEITESLT
jgi:crossover junction endodeoxyribonuclease RusA